MATLDIFRLVFIDILKISSSILYKYPTISDQIFYLLFIPHVVLFLFLLGFGAFVVPEGRDEGKNRGLRYLVTATGYIFIIYEGWYGTILIPLFQAWFWIMVAAGLFMFLIAKIFHPVQAQALSKVVASGVGGSMGKQMAKGKELEMLQKELDETKKLIVISERELRQAHNEFEKARASSNLSALRLKERELKRRITKY